jgi:hypothetical protein
VVRRPLIGLTLCRLASRKLVAMETIEQYLESIRPDADRLRVRFREPLPEAEIVRHSTRFTRQFGLQLPDEYVRMLRLSNGFAAPWATIDDIETLIDQNETLFEMETTAGTGPDGTFEIRSVPLTTPRDMPHISLGYEGNSAEQVYDLATQEYRKIGIGGEPVFFRSPSLVGLLKYLIDVD